MADVPQDISNSSAKRRSVGRTLVGQSSTPILSPPPRSRREVRAVSYESLNGSGGGVEMHVSTGERRVLTLAPAATFPVTNIANGSPTGGTNSAGRRVIGVGTGTGANTFPNSNSSYSIANLSVDELGRQIPSQPPSQSQSLNQSSPISPSSDVNVRRPSPLAMLMRRGLNGSNTSLATNTSTRLHGFPEPPMSPPPASPLPEVPSTFAAQQREGLRSVSVSANVNGIGGGREREHERVRSKTLPAFPLSSSVPSSPRPGGGGSNLAYLSGEGMQSPLPPPLPDKAEERANAEAVALLKEHAVLHPQHPQHQTHNQPQPHSHPQPPSHSNLSTRATESASTRTKRAPTNRHNQHQRDVNATPVPSMIQSDIRASEDEYDLADYRSLRSTKKKRRLSDLSTWASIVPVPVPALPTPTGPPGTGIPPTPTHNTLFPGGAGAYSVRSIGTTVKARDASEMAAGGGNVWEDLEFALKSIVNPRVFRDFVRDSLGRYRFREFLIQEGGVGCVDVGDLDLWVDLSYATRSMGEIRSGAQAVYGVFLSFVVCEG